MSVVSLEDYRKQLAGLPPEAFLGSIVWYSITGNVEYVDHKRTSHAVRVKLEDLEKWFVELGLDTTLLPSKIKKVDAFRKASSEAQCEYDTSTPGVKATLSVEEVKYDNETVVRHMVKKMTNSRSVELSYDPHVATLTFYRGSPLSRGLKGSGEKWKRRVMPQIIGSEDEQHVVELLDEVGERYDALSEYLHADGIRSVIRNYVTYLNAISVKPAGGVYFIHNTRQVQLDALQELVSRIGQGSQLHQLPLVDTQSQREMLTDAFQTEVEDDVRLLLKDLATANDRLNKGKRGLAPAQYGDLSSRYTSLVERAEEYSKVLGLAQGRAASALEMALDAIVDLAGKVRK